MKRSARRLLAVGVLCALTAAALCHPRLGGILLTPLQKAASTVSRSLSDAFGGSWKTRCVAAETELAAYRQQESQADALRRQNEWYRSLLGAVPRQDHLALTEGQVIAADPADPTGSFTVDIGALDGIAAGDPVLVIGGLAGVVDETGLTWAHVRSLYHPETRVSVLVSRTEESGFTAGPGADGSLALTSFPAGSAAQPGDMLVTSGLGGACPAGLVVGRITAVSRSPDGVSDVGTAAGPAPVEALTRVMVVTDFAGKLS